MNVPQEELDEWADLGWLVNGDLLRVAEFLRRTEAPNDVQQTEERARNRVARIFKGLQRAGAHTPLGSPQSAPEEQPPQHLSSAATREYARAIRAAAVACRAMKEERHGRTADAFAEMLEDAARDAELEVFGPQGLQEGAHR